MSETNGKPRAENGTENGHVAEIPADMFDRVNKAHDLRDRLYRAVDYDQALLMVLCEAKPEGIASLEQFLDRVEKRALILRAIKTTTV